MSVYDVEHIQTCETDNGGINGTSSGMNINSLDSPSQLRWVREPVEYY